MRILVVGSGGREHALAWKLSQSPLVEEIFIAPGNGGKSAKSSNIDIDSGDIDGLVAFAKSRNIDLVVPGPEAPLVKGITDAMEAQGIACFGPDKYCSQIEGSKSFAKQIMQEAGVPTARYEVFTDPENAREYIKHGPDAVVIKADGLASGKGVIIANSHQEALSAVDQIVSAFPDASSRILIEELLGGEEVSLLCLCDGETALPLSSAQDHKAAYDHDKGPNTGGMGAYSPAPVLPDEKLEEITDQVIRPVLRTLAAKGHPYRGVLYAGLMMTAEGPKVLEYNARFGDPECQPLLTRMTSDLAGHMSAACKGKLAEEKISFSPDTALCVVLAAKGYPGEYEKGMTIEGIEEAEKDQNIHVFVAGAKSGNEGLSASGGRILGVTGTGKTLPLAQEKAYSGLSRIRMTGGRFRSDIGLKGIMRLMLARY